MAKTKLVKFVWKWDAMVKLRTSPEAFDALKSRGETIARSAGPGHEVTAMVTRGGKKRRARVQITAVTDSAKRMNSKHNTMLSAMAMHSEVKKTK